MSELFPTVTVDGVQYIRLSDYSTAIDKLIATESKLNQQASQLEVALREVDRIGKELAHSETRLDAFAKLVYDISGQKHPQGNWWHVYDTQMAELQRLRSEFRGEPS